MFRVIERSACVDGMDLRDLHPEYGLQGVASLHIGDNIPL